MKDKIIEKFTEIADEFGFVLLQEEIVDIATRIDSLYAHQPAVSKEPFNGFWTRLMAFIIDVEVHDAMSEEEKDMIINVCDSAIGKIAAGLKEGCEHKIL